MKEKLGPTLHEGNIRAHLLILLGRNATRLCFEAHIFKPLDSPHFGIYDCFFRKPMTKLQGKPRGISSRLSIEENIYTSHSHMRENWRTKVQGNRI